MLRYVIRWDEENAYWTTSVPGPSGVTQNYSLDINDAALFCAPSAAAALMMAVGLEADEHTIKEIRIERS